MGCGGPSNKPITTVTTELVIPKNSIIYMYSEGKLTQQYDFQFPSSKIEPESSIHNGISLSQRVRRSQLPKDLQSVYDNIITTVLTFKQSIKVQIDQTQIPQVLDAFYQDFPDIFWTRITSVSPLKTGEFQLNFSDFDQQKIMKQINQINEKLAEIIDLKTFESAIILAYEHVYDVQIDEKSTEIDSVFLTKTGSKSAIIRAFQLILLRLNYQTFVDTEHLIFKNFADSEWNFVSPTARNCLKLPGISVKGVEIEQKSILGAFSAQKVGNQLAEKNFRRPGQKHVIIVEGYAEDVKSQIAKMSAVVQEKGAGFAVKVKIVEITQFVICEIYVELQAEFQPVQIDIQRI